MTRWWVAAALLALAACDGNPFVEDGGGGGGGGGRPVPPEVPAVLKQNLDAAVYDPATQTLRIRLASLDASPLTATYTRTPALDVAGYEAYVVQETTLQRKFVALFKASERGTVQAGVVADGGQFNRYFGGGTYSRMDLFTMPDSGLASYVGSYAGVITLNNPDDPAAPMRTEGTIVINADFTDMSVNGGVIDRSIVETGEELASLALVVTDITANGDFQGNVEFLGDPNRTIGTYGGLFGGVGASDLAGVLVIRPIADEDQIFEHGVFVLPKCGTPGDSALCP